MLNVKKNIIDALIKHAKSELPIEACGYFAEMNGEVSKIYTMKNIDNSSEHFSFDPKEQFEVIKDMRSNGYKTSAVFHSHPETPARPSREDIQLAYDPNISYVIISLAESEPVIKSFKIKDGTVTHEEINIIT